MNNNNLTIRDTEKVRLELKDKINESVHELNEQFISNPNSVNTETLKELIKQRLQMNKTFDQQRSQLDKTCWNKNGSKIILLAYGTFGLGVLMCTVTNIFQFIPSVFNTDNSSPSTTTSIGSVTSLPSSSSPSNPFDSRALQAILGIFITGVLLQIVGGMGSYFAQKKDQDEKQLRQELENVKPLNEIYLFKILEILEILETYKAKPREERDPALIQQCVKKIKEIPKTGELVRIEKKHLVPYMIENLPPNNPLFNCYNNLKNSTEETDTSLDTVETKTVGLYKDDSGSIVNDMEEVSLGETATAAASMPGLGLVKRKASLSEEQKRSWLYFKMEESLGFKINAIRINRLYLQNNGKILELPKEVSYYAEHIDKDFDEVVIKL